VPDPARPAPELTPEERLRAILEVLRRLTAARSRREPAVLVFEDLHWVDPDTETIVETLVDAAAGTRSLVLLNFRPEYRPSWIGRTHYQQIALRPLDSTAAATLLGDWLGADPSLGPFVEQVVARTGGNPFFMEEVVQAQIESGGLVGTRGRFRLARPTEDVVVPPSVQSLLAARIDRLEETSKQLLQTAAVIGDELPEALLERVAGGERDSLQSDLRTLVQSEFLYQAALYPESEYAFKHPLTREVAYASLLKERRKALHAAVAEAIESLAGDTVDQHAALLAHHLEQAGRNLESARWQARTAARLGLSAGESLFHWRKVTELLSGEAEAPEARALLGEARTRLIYAAGRSAAPEAEVARMFEEATRGFGGIDTREHVVAIMSYAMVRSGAGAFEEGSRLLDDAEAMARRLGDPGAIAAVLAIRLVAQGTVETPQGGDRIRAELDRLCANDPGLGEDLALVRPGVVNRATHVATLIRRGRAGEVEAELAELRRRAGPDPRPLENLLFHNFSATSRARRGDADAALEHGRQALEIGQRSQNHAMLAIGRIARGHGLFAAGRFDEAVDVLEKAVALGIDGRTMLPATVGSGLTMLARAQLARGEVDVARSLVERGIELTRGLGFRYAETHYTLLLARALVAGGDAAGAERALVRAAELATELDARDHLATLEEVRAELAALRGDGSGAERAWREAARRHRENGEEWLAEQAEGPVAS
jgi:tetratricopeptide (TPR) repeat protein